MKESDLCAEFKTWLINRGFTVYPEQSDWDMVAIPSPDRGVAQLSSVNGNQLGIQAKMVPNVDVLYQSIRDTRQAPDLRMVLVPCSNREFIAVAKTLGLGIASRMISHGRRKRMSPNGGFFISVIPKQWNSEPLWLPPITTDLPAGAKSPLSLTKWRVAALKICRIADSRSNGHLTSADFKAQGITTQTWIQNRWMIPVGKDGRSTIYKLAPTRRPDIGWEQISKELADEENKLTKSET
jgi:hypothetical protein